jgi:hypothetical protein
MGWAFRACVRPGRPRNRSGRSPFGCFGPPLPRYRMRPVAGPRRGRAPRLAPPPGAVTSSGSLRAACCRWCVLLRHSGAPLPLRATRTHSHAPELNPPCKRDLHPSPAGPFPPRRRRRGATADLPVAGAAPFARGAKRARQGRAIPRRRRRAGNRCGPPCSDAARPPNPGSPTRGGARRGGQPRWGPRQAMDPVPG